LPSLPGILLLCAILAIIARSSDAGGVVRTIAGSRAARPRPSRRRWAGVRRPCALPRSSQGRSPHRASAPRRAWWRPIPCAS